MSSPENPPSLAKGVASLYGIQLFSMVLSVVTQVVVGRYLSPADYGSYATSYFVVTLATIVSSAGLITALIRHPSPVTEADEGCILLYQTTVGALLGAALFLTAPSIGTFFARGGDSGSEAAEIASMVRWLSLMPVLEALMTIPTVRIERKLMYPSLAGMWAIWIIFERAALVALIVAGARGFSYAYARLMVQFLMVAMLSFSAGGAYHPARIIVAAIQSGLFSARGFFRFGFAVQLKSASTALVTGINPFLGARLFTTEQVGLVAWSHNMATTLGQPLPQSMGRVLLGASSKLHGSPDELRLIAGKCLLVSTSIVTLLLAIVSATMQELLVLVFNPRWHDAAPLFAISCIIMAEGILLVIYDVLATLLGLSRANVQANWAWGIACLVVCWILGVQLGPSGLLWGTALATLVPLIWLGVAISGHVKLDLARNFFLPLAVSCALGGLAYAGKGYAVAGIGSLLIYAGLLFGSGVAVQAALSPTLAREIRLRVSGIRGFR